MTDLADAVQTLNALTPGGIAALMRAEGVRGVRQEPLMCPVARYLGRRTGRLTRVTCGHFTAGIVVTASCEGDGTMVVLTDAVADFVKRFDLGGYPDLAVETLDDEAL